MRESRNSLQKIRRLMKLMEYLQSGRGHNSRDLAELCGITRRQVFRDLRLLQDAGLPVQFDSGRQSYRLPQATFLPPLELTVPEALSLIVLALGLGDGRRGIPLQEPARDAAIKLLGNLPAHFRQQIGDLAEQIHIQTPARTELTGGPATLERLHAALRRRRRLRLLYDSLFEQRQISTLLSPYKLLFVGHSWYVIGRSSLHRTVRTFHIGRILNCELLDDEYEIPRRFTLERYLGNAWRLIRERGPSRPVRVRFQPLVARNVAEVVWHHTQQLDWNDDGTLDFRVRVDGLQEISWWVLGYGDQAEVLEPPELRELVRNRIAGMQARYRRRGGSPGGGSRRPAKAKTVARRTGKSGAN